MKFDPPKIMSPTKFRQLPDASALLGDRKRLWQQFDEKGYLFFRNVLDLEAIAVVRKVYTDLLVEKAVIEAGDKAFHFTRKGLSNVNYVGPLSDELALGDRPWKAFKSHPSIKKFFFDLVGHDPAWVPIVEYKAAPPQAPEPTRFKFVHQDSVATKGFPFRICWIPLADIGDDVGGLAIAEGMHHRHWHDPGTPFIQDGVIPSDAWMRVDYRPGDLLIMHESLPHTGVSNLSDKMRLSLDMRFVPDPARIPASGEVSSAAEHQISITQDDGSLAEFAVDSETTFHGSGSVAAAFAPGDQVIVAHEKGRAVFIRLTSFARHEKGPVASY